MNKEIREDNPRHAPPKGHDTNQQELLYDPNVATSTHAEQAQSLAKKMPTGTLCTMSVEPSGYPYGSFVAYAMYNGNPIFLISRLAVHTKNLQKNSKASLLISENGEGNPLALGRVTLVGECTIIAEEEREDAKQEFISIHESASFYVDFKDFDFYCLKVEHIRYIGGFGRMSWVEKEMWFEAEPDPLTDVAMDIIAHMNEDHSDAMVLYCKTMSKATDTTEAVMTGIDRYGFEMSATTSQGLRPIRLAFENEVSNSEEARKELVRMVNKARKMLSEE